MEDNTVLIARLRDELAESRFRLDSLGAAGRLIQRDRIASLERQIRGLTTQSNPPAADAHSA
jgi:hypothetical protein